MTLPQVCLLLQSVEDARFEVLLCSDAETWETKSFQLDEWPSAQMQAELTADLLADLQAQLENSDERIEIVREVQNFFVASHAKVIRISFSPVRGGPRTVLFEVQRADGTSLEVTPVVAEAFGRAQMEEGHQVQKGNPPAPSEASADSAPDQSLPQSSKWKP